MEIRRYNDKVNVPISLLKQIGVSKGEYVTFEYVEECNFIIIEKSALPPDKALAAYQKQLSQTNRKRIKEIPKIPKLTQDKEYLEIDQQKGSMCADLVYHMKTSKRNELTIPATIFNRLELSEKNYIVIAKQIDDTYNIRVTPNETGKHKFRKSNVLSMNELGKICSFKSEPGTKVTVTYRSAFKNIDITFKYEDIEDLTKSKTYSLSDHIKEKSKPIPTYYETTDIQTTPEDKARLADIQNEMLDTAKANKNKKSKESKLIDVKRGKPITVMPGPHIRNITDAEIKEQNLSRLQQIYKSMQKDAKQSKASIKFIDKEDLPKNQTNCYYCNIELTDKDDSMVGNKRICNQCKHVELERFFQPLRQMMKVKQRIKQLKSESETTDE